MDEKTKKKKLYKKKIAPYQPKPNYIRNCLKAFLVGGFICGIGQGIANFYIFNFNITQSAAGAPTIATLILIASLLTAFGVYDRIGQFAGAGSIVPVTGFANSITSAALEHRSEGLVHGIAANMFKISGAVIVFGVVSAYVVSMVRLLVQTLIS
ncbi:stage V sporulation protein AC [Anaerobacillus sp. MEB173]|uniref:stage V sporulation protein AC n=1 Tax=Anaerobacillus sp. MEB173 TaxID=3383345 RepID=UPI003F8E3D78